MSGSLLTVSQTCPRMGEKYVSAVSPSSQNNTASSSSRITHDQTDPPIVHFWNST